MTEYVAGFLFDKAGNVALIEKQKPAWQAGMHNAIGGKVEANESPSLAMRREFLEETGAVVYDWNYFASLSGNGFMVHFYYSIAESMPQLSTMETEVVSVFAIDSVRHIPRIPNVDWLIPMALSMSRESAKYFQVSEAA